MGQCRTLDADVPIVCYYSSCDNTIPIRPFLFGTNFLIKCHSKTW